MMNNSINYLGIGIILKDNNKLIINCFSSSQAPIPSELILKHGTRKLMFLQLELYIFKALYGFLSHNAKTTN